MKKTQTTDVLKNRSAEPYVPLDMFPTIEPPCLDPQSWYKEQALNTRDTVFFTPIEDSQKKKATEENPNPLNNQTASSYPSNS